MSNTLGILGIAHKAGFVEIGEERSGIAARAKKARLLLTAQDAADNTVRRIANFAQRAAIPYLKLPCTKFELGGILGINACAAIALTDAGLAANLASKLEADSPGTYTQALEELTKKADRIQQRKKEARAHDKNVKTGRYAASKQKGRNTNG